MHDRDSGRQNEDDHFYLRFQLASANQIRGWSMGEVRSPKILAVDEQRFHVEGLFSEQIFGPVEDWNPSHGASEWKMGHIELPFPILHPLFRTGKLLRIVCDLLEINAVALKEILNGDTCVVTETADPRWKRGDLLNFGMFKAEGNTEMSDLKVVNQGEAIRWMLRNANIDQAIHQAKKKSNSWIGGNRVHPLRQLQQSGNQLDWLVLDVIPVIAPALRPFRFDSAGKPQLHWLNRLYQNVLNHCRYCRKVNELNPPEVIRQSLSSKLQNKVERLFLDFDALRFVYLRSRKWSLEPLLRRTLRGRTDRFFSRILRNSIRLPLVPNPSIPLSQCGLPRVVETLELYSSVLWPHFERRGLGRSQFLRKLRHPDTDIWDVLEQELPRQAVLLTQHQGRSRSSLLAFQPTLMDGVAIQVSPMIAKKLFADSNSSDVTAYLLKTRRGCAEAINLMQIDQYRNPANGLMTFEPTPEMSLGCLQLTMLRPDFETFPDVSKPLDRMFRSLDDVISAFEHGAITLQTRIGISRRPSKTFRTEDIEGGKIITSAGRVLFNEVLPRSLPFVNQTVDKGRLIQLLNSIHAQFGLVEFKRVLEKLQSLTMTVSMRTGFSLASSDFAPTSETPAILERAKQTIAKKQKLFDKGVLTITELKDQRLDTWEHACEQIRLSLIDKFYDQPLMRSIVRSGLINRFDLMRTCALFGLVNADKAGKMREQPILSSWCEGLTVSDYWHVVRDRRNTALTELGRRREIDDIVQKLLRRMAYISVTESDCGTSDGVVKDCSSPGLYVHLERKLREMIFGRTSCENHVSRFSDTFLIRAGELITEDAALRLDSEGITKIKVRSPITCRAKLGVCARCNGIDPSTGELPLVGTAIGAIAAFAIGEQLPGVELRVFGMGGPDHWNNYRCLKSGRVKFESLRTAVNSKGAQVALCSGHLLILDDQSQQLEAIWIPCGAILEVIEGECVIESQKIAEWDTTARPILAETAGTATLLNFELGINCETARLIDGETYKRIIPSAGTPRPAIMLVDQNGRGVELQYLGDEYSTSVSTGKVVREGDRLAETFLSTEKKQYRWADFKSLLAGGSAKNTAILSDHAGTVEEISCSIRGRHLLVRDDAGNGILITIPHTEQARVQKGDRVHAGDRLTATDLINPNDILRIHGETAAADFLIGEFQHFCRSNRISIADQHFELLIRRMLSYVQISEPGDSDFVNGEYVNREDLENANQQLNGFMRVIDCGESDFVSGQLVLNEVFRKNESQLMARGIKPPAARPAIPAMGRLLLLGIDALPLREQQPLQGLASPASIGILSLTGQTQELNRVVDRILLGLGND